METISVIMGTRNQMGIIQKAIEGWENQAYKDFAVYICDDGSDDGTKEWIKKYKPKNIRIHYFRQDYKGMRLARNLNKGIKASKGKYVLFAMADSVPNPDYLEKMAPLLNKRAVLCGVRENVTEDMEHISWDWRYRSRQWQLEWDFRVIRDQEWSKITGNGLLIPRKALMKVGMWPEGFEGYAPEDNLLTILLLAEDMLFLEVPRAILKHIEHRVQLDVPKNIKMFQRESKKIFSEIREKIQPQQVTLTFDDFSPVNANMFLLKKLKENYPKLKATLFIIPESVQTGEIVSLLDKREFCKELRNYLDWIEFCPHGWHHPDLSKGFEPEFINISYYETKRYIKSVEDLFSRINLPYKKIFKAPQYKISEAAKDAFRNSGWTLSVSGPGEYWPTDINLTTTNWNIRQDLPLRKKIISYGHIQDVGNGLHECWHKLLQMPPDTEFKFLSEVVHEKIGLPPHL